MKNVMKTEILTVKKKRQKSIEKELGCEFKTELTLMPKNMFLLKLVEYTITLLN